MGLNTVSKKRGWEFDTLSLRSNKVTNLETKIIGYKKKVGGDAEELPIICFHKAVIGYLKIV